MEHLRSRHAHRAARRRLPPRTAMSPSAVPPESPRRKVARAIGAGVGARCSSFTPSHAARPASSAVNTLCTPRAGAAGRYRFLHLGVPGRASSDRHRGSRADPAALATSPPPGPPGPPVPSSQPTPACRPCRCRCKPRRRAGVKRRRRQRPGQNLRPERSTSRLPPGLACGRPLGGRLAMRPLMHLHP